MHNFLAMNPASALRKKAAGVDAFRRKDKDKERYGKGTPYTTQASSSSLSPSMPMQVRSRVSGNFPAASGPMILDIHRFADENWQPDECMFEFIFREPMGLTLFANQMSGEHLLMPTKNPFADSIDH